MNLRTSVVTDKEQIAKLTAHAAGKISLFAHTLVQFESLAHGLFSPLTAFPTEAEIASVLRTWRLPDGTFLAVPPLCAVSEENWEAVNVGKTYLLQYENKSVGVLTVTEKHRLDKKQFIADIFGTDRPDHPGVALVLQQPQTVLSGPVKLFAGTERFFTGAVLTPEQCRIVIAKREWKTVAGFSTSSIPHRAHEYLHRAALDCADGLVVQAIQRVGGSEKHAAEEIAACYDAQIKNYYPKNRVLFTFLPMNVLSAGPRETGLQAVIRQNYGITHFVLGRDHCGFQDTYGVYESHEIFERFKLPVTPLKFSGPFYCFTCKQVVTDRHCSHTTTEEISGTRIRTLLRNGEQPPEHLIRPEVLSALVDFRK